MAAGGPAAYRVHVYAAVGISPGGWVYSAAAPGGEVGMRRARTRGLDGNVTVEAELRRDYVPAKVGKDGAPFAAAWRSRPDKAAVVGVARRLRQQPGLENVALVAVTGEATRRRGGPQPGSARQCRAARRRGPS